MYKPAYRTLENMVADAALALKPLGEMNVVQLAEAKRRMNNPGSYVGPYKSSYTPYMAEPQECLTSLDYTGVIFVSPARTGKTDSVLNWLAYSVDYDPADMMLLHMTKETGREWSQKELSRFFRNNDFARQHLIPGRQNDNVFDKKFKSGMVLSIGWPTITQLSGKNVPRCWAMDYDRMPQDVDGEGNPFDLLAKRTTTYKRFGMTFAESSPGFEITDPKWVPKTAHEAPPTDGILKLYNRGDRRRWQWRCPGCDKPFEPKFNLLKWPDSDDVLEAAEQVYMVCPNNGCIIEQAMKEELNETRARWVKEGQIWMPDGSILGTGVRSKIASFWMFGPAAKFQTWTGLVTNYLNAVKDYDATGSEDSLKSTTNVDQGEPYLPKSLVSDRQPDILKKRATDWGGDEKTPVVPAGCRFLVATIDVQSGARSGFVVHVHGYGEGNDVWIIDTFRILRAKDRLNDYGDKDLCKPASYLEDWEMIVDQVFERTYALGDQSNRYMKIKIVGCDSGGEDGVTSTAYQFYRKLRNTPELKKYVEMFHLIKGTGTLTAPRARITYPDAQSKNNYNAARGDVPVLILNSNLLKDQISNKLERMIPGGGRINFPIWAKDWLYKQLCAEIRDEKGKWEKLNNRMHNEAWDLLYYAEGLLLTDKIKIDRKDFWVTPPMWAQDWDSNSMIIYVNPDGEIIENENTQTVRKKWSMADLGKALG